MKKVNARYVGYTPTPKFKMHIFITNLSLHQNHKYYDTQYFQHFQCVVSHSPHADE